MIAGGQFVLKVDVTEPDKIGDHNDLSAFDKAILRCLFKKMLEIVKIMLVLIESRDAPMAVYWLIANCNL